MTPRTLTAESIIHALQLQRHPVEGGYFRETYRSSLSLPANTLPTHAAPRSVGTAIYYLLTPDTFSEMHRLPGDEIFHFYLGDPVEQLHLLPDGSSRLVVLGPDVLAGQQPQVVVPAGVWQGARLLPGGRFALLGATMAPGFDYADYQGGSFAELSRAWPDRADWLKRLTRA
jgi:predicted cupin superfamily sugar epimerase